MVCPWSPWWGFVPLGVADIPPLAPSSYYCTFMQSGKTAVLNLFAPKYSNCSCRLGGDARDPKTVQHPPGRPEAPNSTLPCPEISP